jgi:hypothetical protein
MPHTEVGYTQLGPPDLTHFNLHITISGTDLHMAHSKHDFETGKEINREYIMVLPNCSEFQQK